VLPRAGHFCFQHHRQAVEELPRRVRQRRLQFLERVVHVAGERRRVGGGEDVPSEVERAQFDRAESHLLEPAERPRPQLPHRGAVDFVVVDGEPGAPERVEVAPDRALMDAPFLRQARDRDPRPRRVDLAEDLPLPHDLGVACHRPPYS
jgi:hypothetical protein